MTGGAKTWGAPPRLESAVDAAESSPSSYDDAATASAGPRGAMPSHVVDTFLSDASPFLPLFCPLRVAASRAIACSPPPPNRTAAISTHHPPQQHRHIPIPSPSPLTSLPFSGSRIAAFAAFGGAAVYVSPFESYLVDHYVSRVLSSLPHCSAHQHADGVPGGDMHERLMLARWVPLALSDEGMLAGLCLASCRSLAYEFAVGRTRRRHAEDTRGRPSDSGAEVEEIQEEVQDRGGTSTSTSSPATSSSSADAGAGSTDEHWCNTVTTTTLTKPGMDVGHKVGGLGGSDARIMAAAAAGRWVGAASDVDFAGSSWQNDGTSRWTRAVEKDSPASVPAMEPQLRLYLNRALAFKADCIGSVNRAISESGAWGGVGDATIAKVLMLASDEVSVAASRSLFKMVFCTWSLMRFPPLTSYPTPAVYDWQHRDLARARPSSQAHGRYERRTGGPWAQRLPGPTGRLLRERSKPARHGGCRPGPAGSNGLRGLCC